MDGCSADITLDHQARIARLEQAQVDYGKRMDSVEKSIIELRDELRKKMDKIYYTLIATLATILASITSGIILFRMKTF